MNPGMPTADRYLELVQRVPLRPIRDESSLDAATAMIDELLGLPELSAEEDDYLDVLGDLVEKYEAQAHPIPEAAPRDVLHYLMQCRELSPDGLANLVGIPAPVIAAMLVGETAVDPSEADRLAVYFSVEPKVFLGR